MNAAWWPIAGYTSQCNTRIRAQQGFFTAFNLMADVSEGHELSIENMQSAFLSRFQNEKPFFYKVIIKGSAKNTIYEELRRTGVYEARIYPELEKSCKYILEDIQGYFA